MKFMTMREAFCHQIVRIGAPQRGAQTTDKPCIQERMQGLLYVRTNNNEATSLLMF